MAIIVLTGGPCGGKSTVIEAIRKEMGHNKRVICMNEVATSLLKNRKYDFSEESERIAFQEDVFNRQMEAEEDMSHPGRVLVVDRGLLDGSVYWPEGVQDWCRYFGVSKKLCYDRYSKVIHLESLASGSAYKQTAVRTEDREGAASLDKKIEQVWRHHNNRHIFMALLGLREKIDIVKSHIRFALRRSSEILPERLTIGKLSTLIRQGLVPVSARG